MVYLYGCPVSRQDARNLVATLIEDGTPDALAAAAQIGYALQLDRVTTGLSPEMRDAILAVLDDPPAGLIELRITLGRDLARRAGIERPSAHPSLARLPYRLIVIDRNRDRRRLVVDLDAAPQVGDHLAVPHGGTVIVHHVTPSKRRGHDGIIIAGTP